jgi:hypothetical protein
VGKKEEGARREWENWHQTSSMKCDIHVPLLMCIVLNDVVFRL